MRIALLNFYRAPNPDNRNIASALRERGHTVYLGQRSQTDDLEWYDREGLIAVQPGPLRLPEWLLETPMVAPVLRRLRYLPFLLRIRRWLRQTRPDIVQVNPSSFHGLCFLPLYMPRQMRFLLDIRQIGIGARPGRMGRFRAWWSVRTRCILARWFYDGACFNHVATARRVLGDRWPQWAAVVPVGISPTFLSTKRKAVATDADLPLRFVYLGALSRVREIELLFQAIQRVQASTNNFRVLFVGPDLANGHYQRLGDELGLNGVALLKPPVPHEEIPELLADCDVGLAYVPDRTTWHLQPTIKVLEYRAAGLPILSTDVGGHREWVEQGVNGLLVQNNVESLSKAMLRFINDSDFLDHCRNNAAQMRRALTIDKVARMYEQDVYQKLVE